jgi:hydroxyethylthiazole kinase-like uncharacterized protein yjeF
MDNASAKAEILTVEEMGAADAVAVAAGTSISTLMERAGAGVAAAIVARFSKRPVLVLCGPGDNGGDGYVAARHLREAGWPVSVVGTPPEALKGAAAEAARSWDGAIGDLAPQALNGAELVVDALFGAGLTRPLSHAFQDMLRKAEADRMPIVAVDLPSGLSGDTGKPLDYAPQAALTVTFHRKKPAHVIEPGHTFCGETAVVDIGLAPPLGAKLFENTPDLWLSKYPWPQTDGFKGRRGHLMVVSGGPSQSGAARLSSRGGLRVGAGLVTLLSPPAAVLVNATHLEAVMLKAFKDADALSEIAAKAQAVVIGPAAGVGEATRANALALSKLDAALVVDADVFTTFKDDTETLFAALSPRDVMTPHPGEFERVFPGLLKSSPERIAAAREAASRAGAVVLLKGSDTVVAAPDGRAAVNTNSTPWLGTAGSGDVLAGLIGGLLAQGLPSFEAACAGAWMHGAAGSDFGPGLIAEDLPDLIPQVLKHLYKVRNPVRA